MMETLDVKLRAEGRPNLDPAARQALVDAPEFAPLTNDGSVKLFAQMASSSDHLTAEINGAGVLINYDWTMQIQAETMIRCVQALCIVVNTAIGKLGTAISLDLVSPTNENEDTLYKILDDERKRAERRELLKMIWVGLATGVLSSLLGVVVGILLERFVLGG